MAAYNGNRDSANELTLESSPVVPPLKDFLDEGDWCGTPTELLTILGNRVVETTTKGRAGPKTPRSLSNTLRRLAANLRASGLEVEFCREKVGRKQRMVGIRKG